MDFSAGEVVDARLVDAVLLLAQNCFAWVKVIASPAARFDTQRSCILFDDLLVAFASIRFRHSYEYDRVGILRMLAQKRASSMGASPQVSTGWVGLGGSCTGHLNTSKTMQRHLFDYVDRRREKWVVLVSFPLRAGLSRISQIRSERLSIAPWN